MPLDSVNVCVFLCKDSLKYLIYLPMRNASKFIDVVAIPCAREKPYILPRHRPHISSPTFHLFPSLFFSSISLSPISSISHSFTQFYWCICSELTVPMLSARFTGLRGLRCHVIQSKRQLLVSYQPWSFECWLRYSFWIPWNHITA